MIEIIIGLPILFIFVCVFLTIINLEGTNETNIPEFMLIIGKIALIITGISLIMIFAYMIGSWILGG